MAARRTSTGSGSSTNIKGRAKLVVLCSCGRETVVRTVKHGPNVGKKFHGCPLWPNSNCDFFKWMHEDEEEDDFRFRVFEKETTICQLEYEKQLKDDIIKEKDELIKKLDLKIDMLIEENQDTKLELSQTRIELMRTSRNEKNISMALLVSWILFAFAYFVKHGKCSTVV